MVESCEFILINFRHPGESRDPVGPSYWVPAFAGMTGRGAGAFWFSLG